MTLSPGQEATSPCDQGTENILLDPMDGDLHEPVIPLNTQQRAGGWRTSCTQVSDVILPCFCQTTVVNMAQWPMLLLILSFQCKKINKILITLIITFLLLLIESFYFTSCPGSVQVLVMMYDRE